MFDLNQFTDPTFWAECLFDITALMLFVFFISVCAVALGSGFAVIFGVLS